jgi:hypothetical protein
MKWVAMAAVAACMGLAGQAAAADLITNGGFEDGTRTDTQNGNTNPNAPVGWDVNAAFDRNSGFNQVTSVAHTGSYGLQFADFDGSPVVQVSQTLADVVGQTYQVSFWFFADANFDATARFTGSVNGDVLFSSGDSVNAYTEGTFSFVGTGSDTLAFAAKTDPGEWHLDDVSVVAGPTSAAPEPGTWALMGTGVGLAGLGLRRRRGAFALRTA